MRILVVDPDPRTVEQINDVLWVWPHKVAFTESVAEAIHVSGEFSPSIAIVAIDFPLTISGTSISALQVDLPKIPIIALGVAANYAQLDTFFEQGAAGFLQRKDLHRNTLHNFLAKIQLGSQNDRARQSPTPIELSQPWRDSQLIGALICDIKGTIIAANGFLASSLDYADIPSLLGKNVRSDLMHCPDDWDACTCIAGDLSALLHQPVTIRTQLEQLLPMEAEVFAVPESPTLLNILLIEATRPAVAALG